MDIFPFSSDPEYTPDVSGLTLILPVANVANTKWCKKNTPKYLKPWHVGTQVWVFSKIYLMNTNMRGFRWILKIVASKVASALEGFKKDTGPTSVS